jgi:hypothetical protein
LSRADAFDPLKIKEEREKNDYLGGEHRKKVRSNRFELAFDHGLLDQ